MDGSYQSTNKTVASILLEEKKIDQAQYNKLKVESDSEPDEIITEDTINEMVNAKVQEKMNFFLPSRISDFLAIFHRTRRF